MAFSFRICIVIRYIEWRHVTTPYFRFLNMWGNPYLGWGPLWHVLIDKNENQALFCSKKKKLSRESSGV